MMPMKGPERRQAPRKNVERFAYINIEPSNGGSVLNVSEGGLCFHSIAPVPRNDQRNPIRFWFWEHDHQIEVQGELVWTDESRKTGGIRFTVLPGEAREPMRRWISQPVAALAGHQASALSTLSPHVPSALTGNRPDTKPATNSSAALVGPSAQSKMPTFLRGFSGGLATGLLVSLFVSSPFLVHNFRRQLGESLIYWGERFADTPRAQTRTVSALPQTISPSATAAQTASAVVQIPVPVPKPEPPTVRKEREAARRLSPPAVPILMPKSEKLLTKTPVASFQPQAAKTRPATPVTVASSAPVVPNKAPAPVAASTSSPLTPGTVLDARIPAMPSTIVFPSRPAPQPPEVELANRSGSVIQNATKQNGALTSEMYFELGKFKDALGAYRATDKLARFGLRSTVIQKGHFWTNSYRVLVGPYDDNRAEDVRKKLVAGGFKPQVVERGSRNFTVYGGCDTMSRMLRSGLIKCTQTTPAECVITWETYSTHAIVKFLEENSVVDTADGKWVNRGVRYERDAFVYRKNDDGSRTLLEIQFAGMSHALVFDKSRSTS